MVFTYLSRVKFISAFDLLYYEGFSLLQSAILQSAAESNPKAWWWIKGDGVDAVKGLWESTKGQWSGDADLNDGVLNELYEDYQQRLAKVSTLGLGERSTPPLMEADLNATTESLKADLEFIHSGNQYYSFICKHNSKSVVRLCSCTNDFLTLDIFITCMYLILLSELQRANTAYEEKQRSGKALEKVMLTLVWDVDELKQLNKKGRQLHTDTSAALDLACKPAALQRESNLPRMLASIRTRLCELTKGLFHFKRIPASHLFVLMISSELRNSKPYAIPVQCLPYASLKERDIRHMVNSLIEEMVKLGMNVAGEYILVLFTVLLVPRCTSAGFVSNGEFNYMRSKGYTRPLSVLQVRTDVRNKYAKVRQDALLSMLTPEGRGACVYTPATLCTELIMIHGTVFATISQNYQMALLLLKVPTLQFHHPCCVR